MQPDIWLTRFEGQVPFATPAYGLGGIPAALRGVGLVAMAMIGMAAYSGTAPLHEQDLDAFRTVEELEAHRAELAGRLTAIAAESGGKPMTDEQKAEFEAITEVIEGKGGVDDRITEQRHVLDTVARLAGDESNVERPGADDQPKPVRRPGEARSSTSTAARPNARRVPENVFDLGAYRRAASSLTDEKALIVDGAKFALDDMAFYHPAVDQKAARAHVAEMFGTIQDGPDALARHILAVGSEDYLRGYVLAMGGQQPDRAAEAAMQVASVRAMELGTDSAGGFVVPVQLDPTLLPTTDGAVDQLSTIARVERITGKEFQLVTSGGVTVRRGREGTVMTASEPVLGQPTLRTVQVDGFVPFSFALGIAWQGILPALAKEIADAKQIERADSFIYGDGIDEEPGGLLGTMPDASRITTGALSDTDLYGITGSNANALGPRFLAGANWLGSNGIYNEIRAIAADSDGSALWARLGDGRPPGLLNKGVYEQSTMPRSSAGGGGDLDDYLVLGDFYNFLIVERVGIVTEVAPHLFRQAVAGAGYGVPTGQRGFIAHWHDNAKIVVPNAFRVLTRKVVGSGS